jgi:DNA-binding NarL/FixJ family response regulator
MEAIATLDHEDRHTAALLTRVAIVEDSRAIRTNLVRLIDFAPGLFCVCDCGSAEEALFRIPATQPDVVLMDMNLPGISGAECTARLKRLLPQVPVLMLTQYNDHERIIEALRAGAVGYLLKRTPPADLFAAIRTVRDGGTCMSSEVARKLVESLHRK